MNDSIGRNIMMELHRINLALEKLCEILERSEQFKKPRTIYDYRDDR